MGIPKQVLQKQTTSSEFVDYKVYMQNLPNEFNPIHCYLASLAAEVARSNAKYPRSVKAEDYLIKFTFKEKKVTTTREVDKIDRVKVRMDEQKMMLFAATGYQQYQTDKKVRRPRKPPRVKRASPHT